MNATVSYLSKPSKPSPLRHVIGYGRIRKATEMTSSSSSSPVCPGAPKKPAASSPIGYRCKQTKFAVFGMEKRISKNPDFVNEMVERLNSERNEYTPLRVNELEVLENIHVSDDEGIAYCVKCNSVCVVSGTAWESQNEYDNDFDYTCNSCQQKALVSSNSLSEKEIVMTLLEDVHSWSGSDLPASLCGTCTFVICEGPCNLILKVSAADARLQAGRLVDYRLETDDGMGFRCEDCKSYSEPPDTIFCSTCLTFKPDDHKDGGACFSSYECLDCENDVLENLSSISDTEEVETGSGSDMEEDEYPLTQRKMTTDA